MNKLLLISSVLIAFVGGCRKDSETSTQKRYHTTTINGIKDIMIKPIDSINVPLTISSNDKDHYVTLEIVGLPNYLYGTFTPAIGVPNFATYLSLKSYRGISGTNYTFKLKAKTEAGIEDTFDMRVKVDFDTACVNHMIGTYNAHYECSKSGGFGGAFVSVEKLSENILTLKHLQIGQNNQLDSISVNANCEQVSLSVPNQSEKNGYHVTEGEGYFSSNRIDITYTVEFAETCTVTLTK